MTGSAEPPGDARGFYDGLDLVPVDMTAAARSADPMAADPPFHGSYEDRADAPDRVFAALDDAAFEHQVDAWSRVLADAGAADHDVLHLHHLTPLNAAAERVAPRVPVVGHLHGTELLMLEEPADRWPHLEAWRERMRRWAARCERLIVLSDTHVDRAQRVLGIDPRRCVIVPNGFDPGIFRPRHVDRLEFWHQRLVREPCGWAPGEPPGSVRYTHEDLRGFAADGPVVLYVGRFTAVKRLPLLIEAHAAVRPRFARRAPLVVLGGFPGEWEGEHPLETIRRIGAEDVFLAGWHTHRGLSEFLSAADVVVLPERPRAVRAGARRGHGVRPAGDRRGRLRAGRDRRPGDTGWLVAPDDAGGARRRCSRPSTSPRERIRRGREASRVTRTPASPGRTSPATSPRSTSGHPPDDLAAACHRQVERESAIRRRSAAAAARSTISTDAKSPAKAPFSSDRGAPSIRAGGARRGPRRSARRPAPRDRRGTRPPPASTSTRCASTPAAAAACVIASRCPSRSAVVTATAPEPVASAASSSARHVRSASSHSPPVARPAPRRDRGRARGRRRRAPASVDFPAPGGPPIATSAPAG